jgi:hypothetical protein
VYDAAGAFPCFAPPNLTGGQRNYGAGWCFYRVVPIDKFLARLRLIGKGLSILLAFHLVCFGWIFRAQTSTFLPLMNSIGEYFYRTYFACLYGRGILFLSVIVLLTDYLGYRNDVEFPELFSTMNPYVAARRHSAQFIYFHF